MSSGEIARALDAAVAEALADAADASSSPLFQGAVAEAVRFASDVRRLLARADGGPRSVLESVAQLAERSLQSCSADVTASGGSPFHQGALLQAGRMAAQVRLLRGAGGTVATAGGLHTPVRSGASQLRLGSSFGRLASLFDVGDELSGMLNATATSPARPAAAAAVLGSIRRVRVTLGGETMLIADAAVHRWTVQELVDAAVVRSSRLGLAVPAGLVCRYQGAVVFAGDALAAIVDPVADVEPSFDLAPLGEASASARAPAATADAEPPRWQTPARMPAQAPVPMFEAAEPEPAVRVPRMQLRDPPPFNGALGSSPNSASFAAARAFAPPPEHEPHPARPLRPAAVRSASGWW